MAFKARTKEHLLIVSTGS